MTSWLAVRVAGTAPAARDAIAAALIEAGAAGVQEDHDTLITYLPDDAPLERVREALAENAGAVLQVRAAPRSEIDQDWPPTVGISRAGRFLIAPPWLAPTVAGDGFTIIIDPAMAFGTGEHPTTRGVLRLMDGMIRAGDRVADLGAGSAILAIAAAQLGAERVAAIELDGDAIGNAEHNVRANDVDDRVIVIEGDAESLLPHVGPVRVVLANIISSVLITLLPVIRSALSPEGLAIFSGVLLEERTEFTDALASAGWRVERDDMEDVWWTALTRPV